MIDIHAHLCFKGLIEKKEEIAQECEKEMTAVIVTSARLEEAVCALELCSRHKKLFPTIGFHPVEGGTEVRRIMELALEKRDEIVGIGEVGLDYHWVKEPGKREHQQKVFSDFIKLAEELDKPLIIHSWDAEEECFEMLKDVSVPVIMHCYSGSRELAERILKNENFYISISTHVLLSKQLRKVAKMVPLERMTIETDAPFLSPYKYFQAKGEEMKMKPGFDPEKNYPWNVRFAAEKIAELKGVDVEEVIEKTTENAKRIFGLKGV